MKYASLVCSSHVEMAVRCLSSFVRRGKIRYLYIFDDGSMSKGDIQKLKIIPCNIRFVSREECKETVTKKLKGFDHALGYRKEHAFGIKLVDIPIYLNQSFLYTDTDIMYYRDFSLKNIKDKDIVFMCEHNTSYSVDYKDQFFCDPIRLVKNLNAGLLYVSEGAYAIDKVNKFLGNNKYKKREWLIEQTAWAYLAAACNSGYWSPSQVAIANERGDYSDNVIAVHYISTHRGRLEKDVITVQDDIADSPSDIRVLPSKKSRFTDGIIARAVARFK